MSADDHSDFQAFGTQAALDMLVTASLANIPGAEMASVTVRYPDQRLETLAASHDLARQVDEMQYELGEGPCYDAVTSAQMALDNDLRHGQYPRYGPRAADLGLGSQLATRVANNGSQAGLNIYAHRPHAFDASTAQLAELFGVHVGVVLGYANAVDNLEQALVDRQEIGIAVGLLMGRLDMPRELAFEVLVRISNDRNIKLSEVAKKIVDGSLPSLGRPNPPRAAPDSPRGRT